MKNEPVQDHTSLADHAIPAACANCDAAMSGNYCHNCGQETRLHSASFGEFAHEFIGHYVALEGRLWGTFTRLLFRPGLLTLEYMRGRRKRYVEPLRLYLTLSILFFALLKFTGTEIANPDKVDKAGKADATQEVAKAAHEEAAGIRREILKQGNVKDEKGDFVELPDRLREKAPGVMKQVDHFNELDNDKQVKVLSESFFHYGPYAMFALMPLFALYMKVLYLGSGKLYGEHLLFALHTSSFAFVMFGAIKLVPDGFMTFALLCWLVGYLPWAMKRVYGGGKFGIFMRWSLLMLLHGLSMAIAIGVAMGAGVATAH